MYNTNMIAMIATVYMYILYDLDTDIFQVNLLIDLIGKVPWAPSQYKETKKTQTLNC